MTERVFRRRFLVLWVGFTVAAFVLSRALFVSTLNLEMQKMIYELFCLSAVVVAFVLYRKGSVTDYREREVILAKAELENKGKFGFFNSVFFLGVLAVGLGLGIWDMRYESWKFGVGMLVVAPINLWWMVRPFRGLRNAHLRRMQERDLLVRGNK